MACKKKFYGITLGNVRLGLDTNIIEKGEKTLKKLGDGTYDKKTSKQIKKEMYNK